MEERNIKISLKIAKDWYKQGGDLRKIALQAFSESELIRSNKFPTSWSEYNKNASYKDNRVDADTIIGSVDYCCFATKEEAEAFVALGKLIQLRDEYWRLDNNWKPIFYDYENPQKIPMYAIHVEEGGMIKRQCCCIINHVLVFRTKELRDKFYKNFRDLIEQAKMFL